MPDNVTIYTLIVSKHEKSAKNQKLIRHYDLEKYRDIVDKLVLENNLSLLRIYNLMKLENLISCSYSTFYRRFSKEKKTHKKLITTHNNEQLNKDTHKPQLSNIQTNTSDKWFTIPKFNKEDL